MHKLVAAALLVAIPAPARAADAAPPPCGEAQQRMACVPAGEFLRGSDSGPKDERPQQKVDLDAFWMDLTEVTVADYKACTEAKACAKAGPNYRGFSDPD